jgi:hypothetical protein
MQMRHCNVIKVYDYNKNTAWQTYARMMMQMVMVGSNNGDTCKGLGCKCVQERVVL